MAGPKQEPGFGDVLLDEYFPAFDAVERHKITIAAPPATVFAALRTADLAGHPIVALLLAIRALPAFVTSHFAGRPTTRARAPVTLASFERHGFVVLAEDPPREILIGIQGRFWTPTAKIDALSVAAARTPVPAGTARAGWNFALREEAPGRTVLSTETRVTCGDAAARRRFRWYWFFVRPGSGLIRRAMLASIRRAAERGAERAAG